MELILRESVRVVRQTDSLIITETTTGIVMANSGVDQSNIEAGHALLLPKDPDRSAVTLRQQLMQRLSKTVGVVIADSMGRAWRKGYRRTRDRCRRCTGAGGPSHVAGSV